MSKKTTTETSEVWGLRVDGRVLTSGYSGGTLRSEAAVRSDFDRALVERGTPVLISRTTTTTTTKEAFR